MPRNHLTPEQYHILIEKGTEPPFSGEYHDLFANGIYVCRQCNAPLYRSIDKFAAHCGWPSFDDELPANVRRQPDIDGHRIEIVCNICSGHLGHVFSGEHYTEKNTRHCVNSLSLQFIPIATLLEQAMLPDSAYLAAVFAAGCFWHVEAMFAAHHAVLTTQVGYTGGHTTNPTYTMVCGGQTGHAEAVLVLADVSKTTYSELVTHFFAHHDASQHNRQGVDVGHQYRSAIFYFNAEQQQIATTKIAEMYSAGKLITTEVQPLTTFWPAEAYHQHYFKHSAQCNRK